MVALRAVSRGVPVSVAMRTQFLTLAPRAHIDEAVHALLRTAQGEFPVVDDAGKPVGVLGRADLIRAIKTLGPDASVADAMSSQLPVVGHRATLEQAFKLLQVKSAPAVGVTDRDVVIISVGDSASVSFDAHPGVLFPAVVRDIAAAPDPANGTYAVKVALENSDYKLKSGFIARVTLHSSQRETKAVIPIESLVEADGDVGYVFAITGDNRAKKMKVSIDSFSDGWIALSAGLEGIDEIITDGSAYLKSGTLIHRVK